MATGSRNAHVVELDAPLCHTERRPLRVATDVVTPGRSLPSSSRMGTTKQHAVALSVGCDQLREYRCGGGFGGAMMILRCPGRESMTNSWVDVGRWPGLQDAAAMTSLGHREAAQQVRLMIRARTPGGDARAEVLIAPPNKPTAPALTIGADRHRQHLDP
jgi:hypothetical protein